MTGYSPLFFREIVWIVNEGHLDFQMYRGGERIAARNAKRSISTILRKIEDCEQSKNVSPQLR